ncbi:MAG: hypothetical protein A3208_01065, partial [Candidatus Methanoprimaticola hominis]
MPVLSWNDFRFNIPDEDEILKGEVLRTYIAASRALAGLNGALGAIPNSRMLIDTLPMREAKDSCRIENIVTSSDEIYKTLIASDGAPGMGTREVLGYRKAISLADGRPLSVDLIEEICSSIIGKKMRIRGPGEQVYLKNPATGEVVSTPPSGDGTRELLEQLLDYLRDEDTDPLVRMAAGHCAFETIHPFMDGNGRTGRILNCAVLCGNGLLCEPILYMSDYLIENRREYYRQIRRLNEGRGTWDQWMILMFDCVKESSLAAMRMISDISDLYGSTCDACRGRPYYSKGMMDLLFSRVYCRIGDLEGVGLCERNTASKYLKAMEADGILESEKVGRTLVFKNVRLMDILSRRCQEHRECSYRIRPMGARHG